MSRTSFIDGGVRNAEKGRVEGANMAPTATSRWSSSPAAPGRSELRPWVERF